MADKYKDYLAHNELYYNMLEGSADAFLTITGSAAYKKTNSALRNALCYKKLSPFRQQLHLLAKEFSMKNAFAAGRGKNRRHGRDKLRSTHYITIGYHNMPSRPACGKLGLFSPTNTIVGVYKVYTTQALRGPSAI